MFGTSGKSAATLISALLLLLAPLASAVTLQGIDFSSLPGDRVEIQMSFDGTPPEPETFTIEQPARISMTLNGVKNGLSERTHSLGSGNAREVTVVEAGDRTRVVVSMGRLVPFDSRVEGTSLFLLVGSDQAESQQPQQVASAPVSAPASTGGATRGVSELLDLDFRRAEENEGRVLLRLSNPKTPVNVSTEGGRVRIELGSTQLPERLRRRLDVTDFATPVQVIEASQQGNNTVITLAASGEYDYLAYQADQDLTVTVKPVKPDQPPSLDDVFRYKGEKLSLNFQDIEVRSVLQLIADFTKLNLVASDTVAGRITLRLDQVPWDQALDLILKTKGLDKRQVGNVLMVAPAAEIAAREKLELENNKQLAELAPLRTEFIQIRYANAKNLFALFSTSGSAPEGGTGNLGAGSQSGGGLGNNQDQGRRSLLSERGSAIIDERTNTVIVTDTAERLENVRYVLSQLDVPVRQVLIESRIVTASDNFSEQLGIRWGGASLSNAGRNKRLSLGGNLNTLTELSQIAAGEDQDITFPDALAVDLGVIGDGVTSLGLGLSSLGDYLLDLELSALATDGYAEVVARPKVITADKKKASIVSGVEIPFQEASSSGATSTSFKEAVLSLEVTPQITPDDRIIMDLKVNQDSVGEIFNGVPSINTNEIETQVLVDNGQTVVLGGVFINDTNRSTTKTPFLGDLPYVGRLFRRTVERQTKQEILIFITPKILEDVLTRK